MLGTAHALLGAAVGSFFRRKSSAFAAGVVSHIAADAAPHSDVSPWLDVPLMAGALAAVAALRGPDSPEFWGAVGGVVPDVEHGLVIAGIIGSDQEKFPSHLPDTRLHGPKTRERWSQLLVSGICLAVLLFPSPAGAACGAGAHAVPEGAEAGGHVRADGTRPRSGLVRGQP